MDKNVLIGAIVVTLVLAIIVVKWIQKRNELRKIEQKTAYLELQGYKRRLRNENALRFLDKELLVSLESQHFSKEEARMIIAEADQKVREGKFQEDRAREDHKNRKSAWTGS